MSVEKNKKLQHRFYKEPLSKGNLVIADELIDKNYIDLNPLIPR